MHNLFTMNLGNAMDDNFALAFGRINFQNIMGEGVTNQTLDTNLEKYNNCLKF